MGTTNPHIERDNPHSLPTVFNTWRMNSGGYGIWQVRFLITKDDAKFLCNFFAIFPILMQMEAENEILRKVLIIFEKIL